METWALVVGINKYREKAKLGPLLGAVSDACDFADWVLDPNGGEVEPSRLFFWTYPWPTLKDLTSYGNLANYLGGPLPGWSRLDVDVPSFPPATNRAPTSQEIAATVDAMAAKVKEDALNGGTGEARIFVFFAGHGVRTGELGGSGRQTCFVVDEFLPDRVSFLQGVVPCESLRRALRHLGFSQVLLFLDCCRTDSTHISEQAAPLFNLGYDADKIGWSVGHATEQERRAYETDPPNVRGAFTKTLMDGLRGYREKDTLELSIDGLERYVKSNISAYTAKDQKPYFDFSPKQSPPVIVRGQPSILLSSLPVISLGNLQDGESLEVIDNGNQVVWRGGPFPPGQPEVQLPSLRHGLYELRVVAATARMTGFRWPRGAPIDVPN
jgi:uncharacterized caspase-like protein